MIKDKYYKMTEDMLKNYKKLKDDNIDRKKIEIAMRHFTEQELKLFELLYCSRKKLSYIEISNIMNVSKSTYYELKKKLIFKVSEIIF